MTRWARASARVALRLTIPPSPPLRADQVVE